MSSNISTRLAVVLFMVSFLFCGNLQAANEIYKCTIEGKLVFTDQPCPGEAFKVKQTNVSPAIQNLELRLPAKAYNSDQWFVDAAGFSEAQRLAEEYKAPMIIYFRTDWCPYCVAVDQKLLSANEAREAIQGFVKVKINPEHGAVEQQIFHAMHGKGFPMFLVKNTDNSVSRVDVTPNKGDKNAHLRHIPVADFVARMTPFQP